MNKDMRNFIKEIESLKNILENNSKCFDNWNYKLYGLSYDLYRNNDNPLIKRLSDNEFCSYCDLQWSIYEDDLKNEFDLNLLKIKSLGSTSSNYISTSMLKNNGYGKFELSCYANDFGMLLNYYNEYYIQDNIDCLLEDLKTQNIYSLLRYSIENDINFENLISDIQDIKSELFEIIKLYKYIKKYKKNVDDINNFLYDVYLYDVYGSLENLKEIDKMEVPSSVIEYIYAETNCIVKRAGRYCKIYYSYAKQPIIIILNDNIIK